MLLPNRDITAGWSHCLSVMQLVLLFYCELVALLKMSTPNPTYWPVCLFSILDSFSPIKFFLKFFRVFHFSPTVGKKRELCYFFPCHASLKTKLEKTHPRKYPRFEAISFLSFSSSHLFQSTEILEVAWTWYMPLQLFHKQPLF